MSRGQPKGHAQWVVYIGICSSGDIVGKKSHVLICDSNIMGVGVVTQRGVKREEDWCQHLRITNILRKGRKK